jgi:hypothetical protein
MNVSDIKVDQQDASGMKIDLIFAKRPPLYAVYLTSSRVAVEFADVPAVEQRQRSVIAKLNPLRGDINSLIDGWRSSKNPELTAKARRYDRAVADGLIFALEEDFDSAQTQLQNTKVAITDERTSWARFQYLMVASGSCIASILICSILAIRALWVFFGFNDHYVAMLWLAGGTGTVGAFFSIAIAIRSRTILTDLRARDNFSDAILRILIGGIAGALIIAFLDTKLISFSFDAHPFLVDPDHWIMVMLAAFISGFSERLIPDLLAKAASATNLGTSAPPGGGSPPPKGGASGPVPQGGPASGPTNPDDPHGPDPDSDGCVSGAHVTDAEAMADEDLPPATGGVASGQ